MNLKLTLTKGLVIGGLAALGVWAGDVKELQPQYAAIAGMVFEIVRDLIKLKFDAFLPKD